jgi:PAS domain S-box-containing protein
MTSRSAFGCCASDPSAIGSPLPSSRSTESVMITDLDARITYVNPAFERVTGYTRDEVIGKNPRFLKSGLQTPWFYDAMWAALTNGLPWVADFVNRRKDGTLFTEEAVISPIRDSSGAITSYVAVKRDVTQERALEERATQLARQRALIAETIRDLRAGDTPGGHRPGDLPPGRQLHRRRGRTLLPLRARWTSAADRLRRRRPARPAAAAAPIPTQSADPRAGRRRPLDRAVGEPTLALLQPAPERPRRPRGCVRARATRPAAHRAALIYAAGSVEEVAVTEALPALVRVRGPGRGVIGRDVAERTEAGRGRDHIADIIARGAFGPVFQPIVDLARNEIVGYEALTRFTDGSNPEVVFAEAAAVGLGLELEMATLQAPSRPRRPCLESAWLNLNASPELILAGEPLRTLLAGSRRRLVLEVTEHTAIADYPAFRAAMAALGPKVEFAVDDAGTGFASLRHIVELRPAFVKLDRSLMAGLESDSARQAMIVGLCHFAHVTGCRLIVEGIETDSELSVLRAWPSSWARATCWVDPCRSPLKPGPESLLGRRRSSARPDGRKEYRWSTPGR